MRRLHESRLLNMNRLTKLFDKPQIVFRYIKGEFKRSLFMYGSQFINTVNGAMALTQVSSNKCCDGYQKVFEHDSSELKCKMKFGIYLPPKAESSKCPVLYWLSEQNFITKAGAQQAASENGIIIVAPDTSPRGCNIEGEEESWDFGTGAGFYVNATQEPWKTNYRMYAYVTEELPRLINSNFPADPEKMSIFGHSMGGPRSSHFLCQRLHLSVTLFNLYDATVLAESYSGPELDILIDQGRDDQFLSSSQLLPDNLIAACSKKKIPVVFRLQQGYDHSYYFIFSFINDHIKHHAKYLNA
ncbi:S-formylglutathione hydrolase [Labeo rohita]|uniref:S-formylglutathione hydrolase n=1 Tax=Labeo rohita TaxID=84645 RepID=A0ABQ8MCN9_LABRO|nr:S-formylglutathione hydrolase [Labeo rohita]